MCSWEYRPSCKRQWALDCSVGAHSLQRGQVNLLLPHCQQPQQPLLLLLLCVKYQVGLLPDMQQHTPNIHALPSCALPKAHDWIGLTNANVHVSSLLHSLDQNGHLVGTCRVPLQNVEVEVKGKWSSLRRDVSNTWNYNGGSYKFPLHIRLTSVLDDVVEDWIPSSTGGQGNAQFAQVTPDPAGAAAGALPLTPDYPGAP